MVFRTAQLGSGLRELVMAKNVMFGISGQFMTSAPDASTYSTVSKHANFFPLRLYLNFGMKEILVFTKSTEKQPSATSRCDNMLERALKWVISQDSLGLDFQNDAPS